MKNLAHTYFAVTGQNDYDLTWENNDKNLALGGREINDKITSWKS